MRCQKSNFASFRNTSLRITPHEPSYTYGEAMLRWGWLLHAHLGGILGVDMVASVELGNGVS